MTDIRFVARIPKELVRKLDAQALINTRSRNRELIHILKESLSDDTRAEK